MSRRVISNIVINSAGMVVEVAVGFLTVPILLGRLGDTTYGLWIVLGALAGYFQFLDLGARGAVGRYVAFYASKDDLPGLNRTVSTAFAFLCLAGLVAGLAGVLASFGLEHVLDVPAAQVGEARLAMCLVSLNMGLFLVTRVFDAILWGFQRFDLLNLVDVPTAIARLALTLVLVESEGGLITLAWITLLTTVVNGLTKGVLAFVVSRGLAINRTHVSRDHARELFGFGIAQTAVAVSRLSVSSLVPVAIGSVLGILVVVPFSIATRLVEACGRFLIVATGVLSPVATSLHATADVERQRQLFLRGVRYCASLSLFFTTGLLLLGRDTIILWTGKADLAYAADYLTILALGAMIPMASYVAESLLVGAARMQSLAVLCFIHATVVFSIVFTLGARGDLGTVCIGLAVSNTVLMGFARMWLVCRWLHVSATDLVVRSFAPACATAVLPALVLWSMTTLHRPENLFELFAYGGVLFATSGAFLLGEHFGFRSRRLPVAAMKEPSA